MVWSLGVHMEPECGRSAGNTAGEAEAQLDVVRAELDELLKHANAGVAVYRAVDDGRDFVFVDFSRGAEEIERIGKADVIGKSVLEIFPGVKLFGLFDVLVRVWRTGVSEHHPISIYRDNRISGWRRNYVCRLPNGLVMAVYSDVTLNKQSEMAARMSEQRFQAIADYTYDWEVWVSPAGRVLWTNPAATRISGYQVEELLAMRDYPGPLAFEPDRNRLIRIFHSAVEGGTGNDQFRIRTKAGHILWAEMSWQPIYDENGHSLGHRESIRDVTARKLAERAAELAEQEKVAILDSMEERILHLDADGSILWANRAACQEIGLAREQIIGRFSEEIHVEWHESWGVWPAVQAMETGRHIDAERTSPEGRTWFVQASPVLDAHGLTVGGVEIALDVSRYKHGQGALQEYGGLRLKGDHHGRAGREG
ncbi:MAG: PAS domain S-box protein [Planctomycetes bacterium]|nr:PAS domain S-box protein [Planctomycetota bacterium]